jgi:hypothetical protein
MKQTHDADPMLISYGFDILSQGRSVALNFCDELVKHGAYVCIQERMGPIFRKGQLGTHTLSLSLCLSHPS